jgi:transcriptional regulator with XRE-family HTH domain
METFTEWLLEEMGRQKMSQQSLAQKSGITPAQVSRIISGQRGMGEKSLTAIAHALKLPHITHLPIPHFLG